MKVSKSKVALKGKVSLASTLNPCLDSLSNGDGGGIYTPPV